MCSFPVLTERGLQRSEALPGVKSHKWSGCKVIGGTSIIQKQILFYYIKPKSDFFLVVGGSGFVWLSFTYCCLCLGSLIINMEKRDLTLMIAFTLSILNCAKEQPSPKRQDTVKKTLDLDLYTYFLLPLPDLLLLLLIMMW